MKFLNLRDGCGWRESAVKKPVRILFLTSIRDVGECDKNGKFIDPACYMEGVIERTVQQTWCSGRLHGLVEVAGVITDDIEGRDLHSYSALPTRGKSWIWPFNLRRFDGTLLGDITFNIPSTFRTLPLSEKEKRKDLKWQFELAVLNLMKDLGADLIVSDHYMARIEFLFPDGLGLSFGKVLNIHPAVTVKGHPFCFRGPTPTADALAAAASNNGQVMTGATLHIVNQIIDDGPVIAYSDKTPVLSEDKPQALRLRNYKQGKLPLFTEGIRHFVNAIYPFLESSVDFN